MGFLKNFKIGTKILMGFVLASILPVFLTVFTVKTMGSSGASFTTTMVISIVTGLLLGIYMANYISKQLKELIAASDKLASGDTNIEINSISKDEIGQLFNSFKKIIAYTSYQTSIVKQITDGNLNIEIKPKSDKDLLSIELLNMVQTINDVSLEMNKLSQAVSDGILDTRADGKGYKGDWSNVVKGLNNIMDIFMQYINIMEEYFDGISKGNVMNKITDSAKGEWENVRTNINGVLDNLYGMLDDVNMLVKAGAEGDLKVRADVLKHQGEFKSIVEGINTMLDEIVKPLTEFEEVLGEMAKGSLQAAVKGNYKGEMSKMKDNLNHVISGVYDHIEETSKVLTEMAKGNLNVEITSEYHGDFRDLKESTNKIIQSFNETFGEINTAAEQVSAGAKQVSDSSQSLSQGSTEQAASVEEITSSVTEIAAQTKENAANASKANEMAESVKENADEGNKQMQSVLKAMEEINVSSSNISKVIKVIDDIAFQTNILALNAAVEAARAGQHGKGFAVVAEEVRNLAARSAKAAKETTGMIEESIKKAEDGKKVTEVTAIELNKVTENITAVADIVSGIAAASNEQATAIGQINQAIEEVSKVTQTNTATAEESASASEELSSQAVLVKERIGRFILKKENKSGTSYKNIDDKTLKIIENMLSNKDNGENYSNSYNQAAASDSSKINISLDDKEFGKY
jgi:methyl-accepting chemotaxis protein